MDRYKKEKADIKLAAEKLEADATSWDKQSDDQMHLHHRWTRATTALQVSITLAAMALETRRKWLEYGMFGVAGVGLCWAAWRCRISELGVRSFIWTEVSVGWLSIQQDARPDPDARMTPMRAGGSIGSAVARFSEKIHCIRRRLFLSASQLRRAPAQTSPLINAPKRA